MAQSSRRFPNTDLMLQGENRPDSKFGEAVASCRLALSLALSCFIDPELRFVEPRRPLPETTLP